jgi:hypothetical protein
MGYAIGIPPDWKLEGNGGKVLIRSPSHLLAVTLAVDRNPVALALPSGEFATRALAAIPGFRSHLSPSKPKPFAGTPLEATRTTAQGTTKATGIRERVTVVVLRRAGSVNYTVAVVGNLRHGYSKRDRAVALRMVRTLRDQPVGERAAPKSR